MRGRIAWLRDKSSLAGLTESRIGSIPWVYTLLMPALQMFAMIAI